MPHVEAIYLENVRRRYAAAAHAQTAAAQAADHNGGNREWLSVTGRTETLDSMDDKGQAQKQPAGRKKTRRERELADLFDSPGVKAAVSRRGAGAGEARTEGERAGEAETDEGARRTEAIPRRPVVSNTDVQAESKDGRAEGESANHAVAATSSSDELASAAPAASTPKANARNEEGTPRASAPAATAATDAHVQDPTQEVAGGDSSRAARERGANEVEAAPLPPHWHESLDPEGRRYYWNRRIGVSQWARPLATTSALLQQRAEQRHERISHLLGLLPRYGHRGGPDVPAHRHAHVPASRLWSGEGYGLHLPNRMLDDPAAATAAAEPHGAGGAPGATAGGAGAALGGPRLSRFQPRASADGGVGACDVCMRDI